jgi:hypothetical protein
MLLRRAAVEKKEGMQSVSGQAAAEIVFGIGRVGYNTYMVVHTFAFRWKAGVREDQKLRAIAAIRGLQGKIPGLLETSVGVNFSPRSQGYELGGVMKFADRPALDAYGGHPIHQELLQWLMPLIDPIEVDFEA